MRRIPSFRHPTMSYLSFAASCKPPTPSLDGAHDLAESISHLPPCRLSGSHPVRHLHVGCSTMQRVCKPCITILLVALANQVVGFPLGLFGRLDSSQPARTVLVQVCSCLLHGGELAGPFLFRQVGTRAWSGWASAIVSRPAVVVLPPWRIGTTSSVAVSLVKRIRLGAHPFRGPLPPPGSRGWGPRFLLVPATLALWPRILPRWMWVASLLVVGTGPVSSRIGRVSSPPFVFIPIPVSPGAAGSLSLGASRSMPPGAL